LPRDQQQIALRARAAVDTQLRFVLDGRRLASVGSPFSALWKLENGEHVLIAEAQNGARSEPVRFVVR
jgi:hypothetical protein